MTKPWNDPRITCPTQLSQYDRRAWIAAGKPPLPFEPKPEPKPAQPAAMTPDTSRAWNEWATKLIDDHGMVLARTIGEEVGRIHRGINEELNEVRAELTALKVELRVLRGEVKGEVALLPNWRAKNVA
jgi:hypothetical protein